MNTEQRRIRNRNPVSQVGSICVIHTITQFNDRDKVQPILTVSV